METLITAYSGADGRPDNSLQFVAYALECGADALEVAGLAGRLILSGTVDAFAPAPGAEVYLNLEEYVPDLYLRYREIPNFELEAAKKITAVCKASGIRAVGTCTAWRDRRKTGSCASLHWLAVSPACQGKGLGRALCRRTLEVFQDLGEFPVYIHTQPWSWKAVLLYVREGFLLQKTDTFGDYENQYALGMEALRAVLPPGEYRELLRYSED